MDQRTMQLQKMREVLRLRDDIDSLCPEKKEKKDLLALSIAQMHQ